jgi:hypothetical protein
MAEMKGTKKTGSKSWPRSRNARRRLEEAYERMCKTELCCKESGKIGRTRRGRRKGLSKLRFHWPKGGKHYPLSDQ